MEFQCVSFLVLTVQDLYMTIIIKVAWGIFVDDLPNNEIETCEIVAQPMDTEYSVVIAWTWAATGCSIRIPYSRIIIRRISYNYKCWSTYCINYFSINTVHALWNSY